MRRYLIPALAVTLLSWLGAAHRSESSEAARRAGAARTVAPASVLGWFSWRGPSQNGTSPETALPDSWVLNGKSHLWSVELSGRGTPVVADGRLYVFGYRGEGPGLQEVVACFDAQTGARQWEHSFNDFLSDIIYDRYSIGSPAIDPETGNVYVITGPGIFTCFTRDGKVVWQHSMMEEYGRLTFPNGRNGSPLIDGDLVIVRAVTGNWGADGAAMDRFYGFDKKSGQLVWSCSPGVPPKDNSFALPVLSQYGGKRVFYTGDGSGNVICVNARTGQTLWRYAVAGGGINASPVLYKDRLVFAHNEENLDNSEIGRMLAVGVTCDIPAGAPLPIVRDDKAEVWRNPLASVSSSPILVGERIYLVNFTGSLCCVNANDGTVLWKHKLAPDELHASPTYGNGKLYVPMQNGSFFIIKADDKGAQVLSETKLEGNCLGAPAIWDGKVYVLTTKRLYCFGKKTVSRPSAMPAAPLLPKPGPTAALQIVPAEVLLHPGGQARFRVRGIDVNGFVTQEYDPARVKWEKYIPPTARVRSEMNAAFDAQGVLTAAPSPAPSAGAFQASIEGFTGTFRGRVLPALPIREDFEAFSIAVKHETEPGVMFAYPPLAWMGARFRWEVRDIDGSKVLAKTLDNVFFQRAMTFIGTPEMRNYTVSADLMSDGNRRTMSTVGLINQRYLVSLLGNSQELEISSNQERVKAAVPFHWQPKVWYRLKVRVDVARDGSGQVLAKAWKRGDPEPEAWTIQVPHAHAHLNGAPGLFGFAPQSLFRVYVDNVAVESN